MLLLENRRWGGKTEASKFSVVLCVHALVAQALDTGVELKSLPVTYLLGHLFHLPEPVFW